MAAQLQFLTTANLGGLGARNQLLANEGGLHGEGGGSERVKQAGPPRSLLFSRFYLVSERVMPAWRAGLRL